MPIDKGRRGTVNPLSSPLGRGGYRSRSFEDQTSGGGGPGLGFRSATLAEQQNISAAGTPFRSKPFSTLSTFVRGTTRDDVGAALGDCTVKLFRTFDDVLIDASVSDGSGNYELRCAGSGPFYVVAYKPGSGDVSGTTVNQLEGSP